MKFYSIEQFNLQDSDAPFYKLTGEPVKFIHLTPEQFYVCSPAHFTFVNSNFFEVKISCNCDTFEMQFMHELSDTDKKILFPEKNINVIYLYRLINKFIPDTNFIDYMDDVKFNAYNSKFTMDDDAIMDIVFNNKIRELNMLARYTNDVLIKTIKQFFIDFDYTDVKDVAVNPLKYTATEGLISLILYTVSTNVTKFILFDPATYNKAFRNFVLYSKAAYYDIEFIEKFLMKENYVNFEETLLYKELTMLC